MSIQTERTETVLTGLMGSRWEALLKQIPRDILVRVSSEAAKNPQAQLIVTFVINLLIRLHPVVNRVFLEIPQDFSSSQNLPRWRKETLLLSLRTMYKSVKPPVKLFLNQRRSSAGFACHVTIGSGEPLPMEGLWIGCNNWVAVISPMEAQGLSGIINPVGAYVAATLGVSEVWKRILIRLQNEIRSIKITLTDKPLFFSSLDYSQRSDGSNPALPEDVGIGRLTIVGLGAGGGAVGFTLASLPGLCGVINLIEPDEVEPSNLNRYVFADDTDAAKKRAKVDCVCDLFRANPEIRLRVWPKPFSETKNDLATEDYRHVIAAVHSRNARYEIQYETPKVLWDAGATEQGDFFIWRMILGETECMFCKHPPSEQDPEREKAKQLSELIGLEPETWLRKVTNNEVFTEEEIKVLGPQFYAHKVDFDIPQPGQRYSEWFTNQCGRLMLPELAEEIPIPFAPVMAGVLLAGEVLKESLFPNNVLRGQYWNNLSARFNPHVLPIQRAPKQACTFCKDPNFEEQYRRRWNVQVSL